MADERDHRDRETDHDVGVAGHFNRGVVAEHEGPLTFTDARLDERVAALAYTTYETPLSRWRLGTRIGRGASVWGGETLKGKEVGKS